MLKHIAADFQWDQDSKCLVKFYLYLMTFNHKVSSWLFHEVGAQAVYLSSSTVPHCGPPPAGFTVCSCFFPLAAFIFCAIHCELWEREGARSTTALKSVSRLCRWRGEEIGLEREFKGCYAKIFSHVPKGVEGDVATREEGNVEDNLNLTTTL